LTILQKVLGKATCKMGNALRAFARVLQSYGLDGVIFLAKNIIQPFMKTYFNSLEGAKLVL